MKNLSAFMLMLLVLLSVMPCTDAVDFSNQTAISTIKIAHSDAEKESCTAMCACVCCGQSVVQTSLTSFNVSVFLIKVNHTAKIHSLKLSEIHQNIWQPPKFA